MLYCNAQFTASIHFIPQRRLAHAQHQPYHDQIYM